MLLVWLLRPLPEVRVCPSSRCVFVSHHPVKSQNRTRGPRPLLSQPFPGERSSDRPRGAQHPRQAPEGSTSRHPGALSLLVSPPEAPGVGGRHEPSPRGPVHVPDTQNLRAQSSEPREPPRVGLLVTQPCNGAGFRSGHEEATQPALRVRLPTAPGSLQRPHPNPDASGFAARTLRSR